MNRNKQTNAQLEVPKELRAAPRLRGFLARSVARQNERLKLYLDA